MKNKIIPKNRVCFVRGCENEQVEGEFVCKEHLEEDMKNWASPRASGGSNIPK